MKTVKALCLMMPLALAGCGTSGFGYFEHPETQEYQGRSGPELSGDAFERKPALVDAGILFVPRVRELAWEPDHRAFLFLYAKSRAKIKVDRIVISSDHPAGSSCLEIDRIVEISSVDRHSGFFRGEVPAIFGGVEGAGRVLAGRRVTMAIHYRVLPSGGKREKRFVLRKKVKVGTALADIVAAA